MVVAVCVNGAVVVDGVEVVNQLPVPVEGISEAAVVVDEVCAVVVGLRVVLRGVVTKSKWLVLLGWHHLKCMYIHVYVYVYIYIYI